MSPFVIDALAIAAASMAGGRIVYPAVPYCVGQEAEHKLLRMREAMTAPILVTGGTGTLGRLVVARLRAAGRDVRVLSRHGNNAKANELDSGIESVSAIEFASAIEFVRADLATGEGVEAAVEGIEIIVHCAGGQKGDGDKARHLVRAASRMGTKHLVYISVVGADRVQIASGIDRAMFGYYESKRAAEEVIADSGIPFSTLRATQFHDLILLAIRQLVKMPVIPSLTGTRFQPVDADEVAARLVELALREPAGLVPDMGGPRVYAMTELIRGYLRATHKRRPILQVRMPGKAARSFRAGANLAPEHATGRRTWEEFLAERVRA
jgi:uncharacterized protein YbjT (DUF2867 family)